MNLKKILMIIMIKINVSDATLSSLIKIKHNKENATK